VIEYQSAKVYSIRPLLEGIIVGLAILLVAVITTYFILHHALIAEKQEIREGMLRQAKIIATLIDGDAHPMFIDPSQEDSSEYQANILPLGRGLLESCDKRLSEYEEIFDLANGCSLIFIYTVILKNEKVYYILDPWPSDIESPDSPGVEMKSHIMDEYPDANPHMIHALKNQMADTTEVYADEWGHFISAYAPFYNSKGEFVGIVGIDMKADRYVKRLEPIKRAATRAFLAVSIIAYLVGATVWFLRRFILIINTKRLALLDAYLKLHRELKQGNE